MPTAIHAESDAARARLAISAIFLVNGFVLASWISRMPTIAAKLDLSSGQIGTALMALAAGAIVAFPLTRRLIGSRSAAIQFTALVYLAAAPLVGLAPCLLLLMPALFIFGAGNGALDVSMNSQGVEVERACGTSIMTSLHGFYSAGAFLDAGTGAAAAHLDLPLPRTS